MAVVKSITIGSAADCDLRVDDQYASPRHCRIDQHDDGTFTITDVGSTNGTWVRRLDRMLPSRVPLGGFDRLRVGDIIRVGRTEIPWRNIN
jgi:pSer/pThr/pTyr-binding forkhead associated (FHA) protein